MTRVMAGFVVAGLAAIVTVLTGRAAPAPAPACDPDNGGLTLPPGFCAAVVADKLGPARHLTVASNGDLFVAIQNASAGRGGVAALRDTDGDGRMDRRERFGDNGGTGIALRNGYLYLATTTGVLRYKMAAGELTPSGGAETMVEGLPDRRQHEDKGIAFDGRGGMYVNVGAPSNACQQPDRQPKVPGKDPCPLLDQHGGIWRFDENEPGQKQADGQRYARC